MQNAEFRRGDRFSGSQLSALRPQRRPRGITLTEVLIAMGIMTVGLLGVAAMFPVGGYYMQKAETADVGSAVAQSALADAVARGMLNPDAWRAYNDGSLATAVSGAGQSFGTNGTFLRQIGLAVRQQLALLNSTTTLLAADKQWCLSAELGSAFVIDPMGVASATVPTNNVANGGAYCFPATGYVLTMSSSYLQGYYPHIAWSPWFGTNQLRYTWPIRRATFAQSSTTRYGEQQYSETQLRSVYAGNLFSSHDDLALDMPDRADLPARQNWELIDTDNKNGPDTPIARQSRGDYSWIITVSPPTSAARDALADGGRGFDYSVSVVVFYKRAIARTDPDVVNPADAVGEVKNNARKALQQQERAVRARVVSTGLTGGELLLEAVADLLGQSPFDALKVGEWIMLCGPHPASAPADPRFVLQWYRVVAIDGRDERLNNRGERVYGSGWDGIDRRLVSLRGPEWPWQPASNVGSDAADVPENLSNYLCVGIFPGAVAVHTRTMRLEGGGSPWGYAGPTGGAAGGVGIKN